MPRTQPISTRYRRIFQHLSGLDLAASENQDLTLEELGLDDTQNARVDLVFGTYSPQGLERALRAYGLLERVEERVGPVEVRVQFQDPYRPRIVVWSRRFYAPVADVCLRKTVGAEVGLTDALAQAPLLYVDSLLLQNPARHFDWNRPPLPGQSHPGLSLSGQILDLLLLMTRRIGAEALALVPSTFAAAGVYERRFLFVDGEAQGRFLALKGAGQGRPRWLVAWAVELGCMKDAEGRPAPFLPTPMLSPLSSRLIHHFDARTWDDALQVAARRLLTLDEEALQQRFPWERMPPGPPPERVVELLGYDPLAPVVAH
ncbi:deacetylase [Pyxidicoccus fallax]|uniref:Deacetylase n=1 Tax=Pyxidicoccus fallax TaxID=394095 RepID=A0A848LVQ5_9BACT|nr:deacetylase [Pyxidicoccus fallax]NMO21513.1 deacetylase [Pyxidicoccus fallax]NPC84102.1 deacetylase [Pyxidicoccus fallax]